MTREQRDEDRLPNNPTTYPPTPGDRNEEARAKRGFGRPAEAEQERDRREGRDKDRA